MKTITDKTEKITNKSSVDFNSYLVYMCICVRKSFYIGKTRKSSVRDKYKIRKQHTYYSNLGDIRCKRLARPTLTNLNRSVISYRNIPANVR